MVPFCANSQLKRFFINISVTKSLFFHTWEVKCAKTGIFS